MAKKRTVFVDVVVDDKGTTKKLAIDSKRLSDGLEKGAKGTKDFDRNLRGVIGTAQAGGRNFAALAQGIAGGIVPVYAAFAAQVFAIGAAFRFLTSAGDLATLEKGQIAYASSTGIALKTLTNRIQEATANQIAFQDAAQAAAIGTAAGLSADQLERLGGAAKDASIVLGRDVTDSFNRLVRGVTKAEPELLDELGIILRLKDATETYAASLGKSASDLTQFEKSQAVANDVLTQAEKKYGEIIDIVDPSINQFNAFGKAFDDIVNSIKTGLNALLGPIAEILAKNPFSTLLLAAPLLNGFIKVMLPGFEGLGKSATNAIDGLAAGLERAKKNAQIEFSSIKLLAGDAGAASEFIKLTNEDLVDLATSTETSFVGFKKLQDGGELAAKTITQNLNAAKNATGAFADMPDEIREEYVRMFTDLNLGSKVTNGKMEADFAKSTSFIGLQFQRLKLGATKVFSFIVNQAQKAAAGVIKAFTKIASGIGIVSILASFLPESFKNLFATLEDPRLRDYLDELEGLNKETAKFVEVQTKLNEDFEGTGRTVPIVAQNIAKLSSTISGAKYNELLEPLFESLSNRGLSSLNTGFEDVNKLVNEQITALDTLADSLDATNLAQGSTSAAAYRAEIEKLRDALKEAAKGNAATFNQTTFLKAKSNFETFGQVVEATLTRNKTIQESFNKTFADMTQAGPYDELLTNLRQQAEAYKTIEKDGTESQKANLALSEQRVKVNLKLLEAFEAQVAQIQKSKEDEIFRARFQAAQSAKATNRGKARITSVMQELAAEDKRDQIQREILTIQEATIANNTELTQGQKEKLRLLKMEEDSQDAILARLKEQRTAAFQIKDALKQGLETGLETNIYDILVGNENDLKAAALKIANTMYETLAKRMSGRITDSLMQAFGFESDEEQLKKTYETIFTDGAAAIGREIDKLATKIAEEQTKIFGKDPETGLSLAGTGIKEPDGSDKVIQTQGNQSFMDQLFDSQSTLNTKIDTLLSDGLALAQETVIGIGTSVAEGFKRVFFGADGSMPFGHRLDGPTGEIVFDSDNFKKTGRGIRRKPVTPQGDGDGTPSNAQTRKQRRDEQTSQMNEASAQINNVASDKMLQAGMMILKGATPAGAAASIGTTILSSFFSGLGASAGGGEGRYGMKPRSMSLGGIARGPQAGYPAVLHGTEAVIPMPSGSIPVEMKGGASGVNNVSVNVNMGDGSANAVTGDEGGLNLGKAIAGAVQDELQKQKRPGGILSPLGAA